MDDGRWLMLESRQISIDHPSLPSHPGHHEPTSHCLGHRPSHRPSAIDHRPSTRTAPMRRPLILLIPLLSLGLAAQARAADAIPKMPLTFNRLYDYPELVAALRALVGANPGPLSMQS